MKTKFILKRLRSRAASCGRAVVTLGMAGLISMSGISPTLAHAEHGHPARIHEGSCEDIGRVAHRLNGVGGSADLDNAPIATPTAVNPDATYQVMVSETTIDGSLQELLATDHAVMVYESDEAMDAIACGNLGGAMSGDSLITGLGEAGTPGHVGFVLFQPQGERITVMVIVGHALAPLSASTGIAEPSYDVADEAHEHAAGEDIEHEHEEGEEDGHGAGATPAA